MKNNNINDIHVKSNNIIVEDVIPLALGFSTCQNEANGIQQLNMMRKTHRIGNTIRKSHRIKNMMRKSHRIKNTMRKSHRIAKKFRCFD